jgi:hypothetical protein
MAKITLNLLPSEGKCSCFKHYTLFKGIVYSEKKYHDFPHTLAVVDSRKQFWDI